MSSKPVKTLRDALAVIVLTVILSVAVYAAFAAIGSPSVALPERVSADSQCPVAGCTSASCHGADPAPELAPGETMICPKVVGCEAVDCHGAERLTSHYNEPKTSSLNVWILGTSIFTIAMIAVTLYVK